MCIRDSSCADDTLGFLSKTTFPVIRGRTYYILVADFQRGAPATRMSVSYTHLDVYKRQGVDHRRPFIERLVLVDVAQGHVVKTRVTDHAFAQHQFVA